MARSGSVALGMPHVVLRTIFWIGLGFVAAASFAVKFQFAGREFGGADILVVLVALLILANAFSRGGRETLSLCRDALAEGARQAVPVGIACAIKNSGVGNGARERGCCRLVVEADGPVALDNGASRAVVPIANRAQVNGLPETIVEKLDIIFFSDLERAILRTIEI